MSAETLRRAAEQIREDYGPDGDVDGYPDGDPFMLAVAKLLDDLAHKCDLVTGGHICFEDEFSALAVARAYLGESA